MLVLVFNISTNHPDFRGQGKWRPGQKTVAATSEVESVFELVAEGLFDENVPDTEDSDSDTVSKTFDVQVATRIEMIAELHHSIEHSTAHLFIFSSVYPDRSGPPPRLV